jgi:hypothetical protein
MPLRTGVCSIISAIRIPRILLTSHHPFQPRRDPVDRLGHWHPALRTDFDATAQIVTAPNAKPPPPRIEFRHLNRRPE